MENELLEQQKVEDALKLACLEMLDEKANTSCKLSQEF